MATNKTNKAVSRSDQLAAVIAKARLVEVVLKSIRAECVANPHAIAPKETTVQQGRDVSFQKVDELLYCFVTLNLKGLGKDEASQFELEVCLSVVYQVDGLSDIDENDISLFASSNAFYNAYPFARELIQSTMQRMGAPVYLLPLLKPLMKTQIDGAKA